MKRKQKTIAILCIITWVLTFLTYGYNTNWISAIILCVFICCWTYFVYDLAYKKSRKDLLNKG